ncbi:hypothetical protein ACFYS7_37550 [Streptomyces avermitilis]|uniref:hypothetical protein n=1 Tax=Streptomyces avermitilis TaxID=33903 RepID=UPI0036949AAC
MSDLLWDEVAYFFDPEEMGPLPDVRVPDASVEDWQGVLDVVGASGWKYEYSEGGVVMSLPRAAAVLSRPEDAECALLRVWPVPDVLAVFRIDAAAEIDFDVDVRELQGQEWLDVFCGFLKAIGQRLAKPVLMDPQGKYGNPVLGFDVEADRVVLLVEPPIM